MKSWNIFIDGIIRTQKSDYVTFMNNRIINTWMNIPYVEFLQGLSSDVLTTFDGQVFENRNCAVIT